MSLAASLYTGQRFDDTTTVMIQGTGLAACALCAFIVAEYSYSVRRIDSSLKVPAATLAKVHSTSSTGARLPSSRAATGAVVRRCDAVVVRGSTRSVEAPLQVCGGSTAWLPVAETG